MEPEVLFKIFDVMQESKQKFSFNCCAINVRKYSSANGSLSNIVHVQKKEFIRIP